MHKAFPRAAVHENLEEALEAGKSDLTLVLTPVHLHASHTILALEHHNHVLCEKPMAATEAECIQMLAARRTAGRLLAIGMIRRFFPAFARFKDFLDGGGIGEVHAFSYLEGRRFDWDVTTPAAFRRRSEGGTGVLFDIGPHAIDLLSWVFGAPEVTFYADDALGGVDVNVDMELQFPACAGRIRLSWDSPLKNELRVVGSKGVAVLRLDRFDKLAVNTSGRFQEVPAQWRFPADLDQPSRRTMCPVLYAQSVYCQLIQVLRAIQLGERPTVGGEEGMETVGVLEAALRRAQPLDMGWLPAAQRQAVHALHGSSA
jgi:predicted dehydrogenase